MFLLATVALFACGFNQKDFEIKVEIEGAEGQILLEKRGTTQWIPVDTADIVDGIAVLRGEVTVPEDHYLSVVGERPKTIVFVENKKMHITGDLRQLDQITVKGSRTHNEFSRIYSRIIELAYEQDSLFFLARSASNAGDTVTANRLTAEAEKILDKTLVLQKDFIRSKPGSFVNPYFLLRMHFHHGLELEELDELMGVLKPKVAAAPSLGILKERMELLRSISIGQIAPDFVMNDPDENPIRFSDVYSQNEYTLLDFWAGWCAPCRVENPNIVAVFNDYKEKGFGVFGVSLDRHKSTWLQAIANDSLNWPQVSDLKYWDNAAARMYAVQTIPASVIVDKNGKIIAKNKREEALRETISELLD